MIWGDLKIFTKIPTLNTERLVLRKITAKDVDDVFEYGSDPLVSRYLLWRPHPDKGYTRIYLNLVSERYRKCEFFDWGIEYNSKMIGTCGFTRFDVDNNSAEIGYVLNSAYWGQGIAYEASCKVMEYGFEKLKLNRIEVRILPENEASKRLALRLGMNFEAKLRRAVRVKGEYKDVCIYSILRNEYYDKKENIGAAED